MTFGGEKIADFYDHHDFNRHHAGKNKNQWRFFFFFLSLGQIFNQVFFFFLSLGQIFNQVQTCII